MKFIDLHCDTISKIYLARREGRGAVLQRNAGHLDLERMRRGNCLGQNFALFTHLKRESDPLGFARALLQVFREEMEKNEEFIRPASSVCQILENERAGRMSGILTVEEGGIFGGDTEIFREFYRAGMRMFTLTWNFENELASPNRIDWERGICRPETERGLTKKGMEFVELAQELGVAVDVSHLGDAGFWDVARMARRPFAASHSNARAVASHVRNLTDEMIRSLAEHGGIMGINYCPAFLNDTWKYAEQGESRISDMVRHICHIRRVGGVECIGLGSDFDGISGSLEVDSPAALSDLWNALEQEGFTGEELEKIFWKNALRFYKDAVG